MQQGPKPTVIIHSTSGQKPTVVVTRQATPIQGPIPVPVHVVNPHPVPQTPTVKVVRHAKPISHKVTGQGVVMGGQHLGVHPGSGIQKPHHMKKTTVLLPGQALHVSQQPSLQAQAGVTIVSTSNTTTPKVTRVIHK